MDHSISIRGTLPKGMKEFSRTKIFTEQTVPEKLRGITA